MCAAFMLRRIIRLRYGGVSVPRGVRMAGVITRDHGTIAPQGIKGLFHFLKYIGPNAVQSRLLISCHNE